MPEQGAWLHAEAGGGGLLLPSGDLREVVTHMPVAPLPGRPRGIQGVVIHHGEFLPVLAWGDLPGRRADAGEPVALAILRPRLGLPLFRIRGTVPVPAEAWRDLPDGDERRAWAGAAAEVAGVQLPLLDVDRLVALLHRFRGDR